LNPEDFLVPETGELVRVPQGFWAFIPASLPPALTYDPEFVHLLSRADAALSELSGLGRLLPNPGLLIAPWIRREAVLSSRIEGTQASLSDVLIDELSAEPSKDTDVGEVRNYVAALEFGIARLAELPLSLRLVRELHERLMRGVRGDKSTPGEFRRSQNWIGPSHSTPATAPYVPPPVQEMHACLDAWEKFLHERGAMPDLVQCALIHEQFEAIHPFLDGNGRVGRLLITLFLVERERLSQPLLYLSDYVEAHRQEYYDTLRRVRTHADWNGWLRFFLAGVAETAADAQRQVTHLIELREKYRNEMRGAARAQQLVDALFTNPYLSVVRARKLLNVTYPTANNAIAQLERAGILQEVTGRKWGRMFVAADVLAAIDRAGGSAPEDR